MSEHDLVNYPDLLGAVTGGARLNISVIQTALAAKPAQVHAGQWFEVVLLVQNACDVDVDVVLKPVLPARDADKQKGRFTTQASRVRIGLQPAEVGFAKIDVSTSPKTAPASGYVLGIDLEVKEMSKKLQRIRAAQGGGTFLFNELAAETQAYIQALRALAFSTDPGGKRHHIQVPFKMLPPALASLKKDIQPDWISLWTLRDYADDYTIASQVWEIASRVVEKLRRETVFMPLLKATQARFAECGYKLHPPEAIFITKLLTLIYELGVHAPQPDDPRPAWPRWFTKLCRLLQQQPELANRPDPLAARLLYADVVYDAIMYAFTMLSTVLEESFGDESETTTYAEDIVDALVQQSPLDFARAYFPLVVGGIIANTRVTMPNEQIRETVFILSKALKQRQPEKNADNAFVFDMADRLIERALDAT
ncbi:MAG: hypothetical protein GYB65_10650 [Chloroflexi bacterium]|nr:hypothetical protein [Chloroflexota bacterium]